MSDFTAIGIVGEILRKLLHNNLKNTFDGNFADENSLTLLSPKEKLGTHRLSLFLYQIVENPHMKNQPLQRITEDKQNYPPLALNLYYLLTPYAVETDEIRTWDRHTVLGKVMQVFYDNATLEGTELRDVLVDMGQEDYYDKIDQIRIALYSLSLDDMSKIWNSLETPLKLSVCYEVRVVLIDSERIKDLKRITEKDAHYCQMTQ
jgi:hypothetical protein